MAIPAPPPPHSHVVSALIGATWADVSHDREERELTDIGGACHPDQIELFEAARAGEPTQWRDLAQCIPVVPGNHILISDPEYAGSAGYCTDVTYDTGGNRVWVGNTSIDPDNVCIDLDDRGTFAEARDRLAILLGAPPEAVAHGTVLQRLVEGEGWTLTAGIVASRWEIEGAEWTGPLQPLADCREMALALMWPRS